MAQTNFSGPLALGAGQFETAVAAKSLTKKDNGKTILITGTGYTYTLPAPAAGLSYRFVVQAAFATNFVVAGGNSLLHGAVDVNSARVNATAASNINFVATAETIGDFAEIWSDGTNWYVDGFAEAIGGITAT